MRLRGVPPRFYRRFCVYGRTATALISSVALRAPTTAETYLGLSVGSSFVVLDEVWTVRAQRGYGHASMMLAAAQDYADRMGWDIMCRPVAHRSRRSQEDLFNFYKLRRFTRHSDCTWLHYRHAS